jgi:multidrug resistance efflux pump
VENHLATEPATRGNLTVIVTANGSAQPITQVNISSELSGTIRKVHVDYNTPVKAGQPLAELDTDKLKATIQSVRAKLDSATARVADTAATIERGTKGSLIIFWRMSASLMRRGAEQSERYGFKVLHNCGEMELVAGDEILKA